MDKVWCLFATAITAEESRALRTIQQAYGAQVEVEVFYRNEEFEWRLERAEIQPKLILFQGITQHGHQKYEVKEYPYIDELRLADKGIEVLTHNFASLFSDQVLFLKLRFIRMRQHNPTAFVKA